MPRAPPSGSVGKTHKNSDIGHRHQGLLALYVHLGIIDCYIPTFLDNNILPNSLSIGQMFVDIIQRLLLGCDIIGSGKVDQDTVLQFVRFRGLHGSAIQFTSGCLPSIHYNSLLGVSLQFTTIHFWVSAFNSLQFTSGCQPCVLYVCEYALSCSS